jgi:cell wall-associated NlpC family hydrolase
MVRRLVVLCTLASAACVTTPEPKAEADRDSLPPLPAGPPSLPEEWAPFPTPTPGGPGTALAAWAERLEGIVSLRQVSRQVPDECTGFVRLAYRQAGVELLGPEALATDNGVTAIYRHAQALGALHSHRPRPGDLAFFEETYDRNRDGKRNDGLTHVALVTGVEPDGTVHFLHRVSAGVRQSVMNLSHRDLARGPSGERWNDVLRSASKKLRAYLTGELFAAYASVDALLSPPGATGLYALRTSSSR